MVPKHVPPFRAFLDELVRRGSAGMSSEEIMDWFDITSKGAGLLVRPFIEHYGVRCRPGRQPSLRVPPTHAGTA